MRADVRDAIEAAATQRSREIIFGKARRLGTSFVRQIVLAVVQELPEEMSMRELREELDIASNQGSG